MDSKEALKKLRDLLGEDVYVPECVALLNEMSAEVEKETIHL